MTRKEYMAPFISREEAEQRHRKYYSQFVTVGVRQLVAFRITVLSLKLPQEKDQTNSFNDIPLARWDALVPMLGPEVDQQLRSCGDWLGLGAGVCILKEAARQLVE